MNIIPALEMKGWRPSETNCTDNQLVAKHEFHAKADFFCRLCSCKMHRRSTRQISITASMDKLKELLNPKKMEPNRSVLVACHQNNQISDGGWEIKTKIKAQNGLYAPYTYSATEFHFSPIQITSYNN